MDEPLKRFVSRLRHQRAMARQAEAERNSTVVFPAQFLTSVEALARFAEQQHDVAKREPGESQRSEGAIAASVTSPQHN